MPLGGGGLRARLLAEHVVRELPAPVLLDAPGAHRRQVHEGPARELAHPLLGQAEHAGQVVVALLLLQHELDDRPLLRRKLIESGHGRAEL